MISQIIMAGGIEIFFVFLTCLFLMKPRWAFGEVARKADTVLTWVGMCLLCLTFCWSVTLGCVLYLNDIVIRF